MFILLSLNLLLKFPLLQQARLIKRYKRFLADVKLADESIITVHCANTGAMTGCMPENARIWLSRSDNPKRKYPLSWELIELEPSVLACINTFLTNKVARDAMEQGQIVELADYETIRSEVTYGNESSRIDFLLESPLQKCYVEVKHVTLKLEDACGAFPDSVSTRGQKHLRELQHQHELGDRAVLLFIIMRSDIDCLKPADLIDAEYGKLLRQVANNGVELLAYKTDISLEGIKLSHSIPVIL